MYVVITGSTKGIGLALAREFLDHDDHVMISSRSETRVNTIVEELQDQYGEKVSGNTVDVTKYQTVERLAEKAVDQWGSIDIWINNAGTTTYNNQLLHNQDPEDIATIVNTNLVGAMYGSKVAIQHQASHIFNMDGLGSNGRVQEGLSAYGSTKRAIPYLSKSLAKETEDMSIGIHTLSPGMVLTDLLVKNSDKSSRKFFNILAERPSVVAKFLVSEIRKIHGTDTTGEYIKFLTTWKIIWRFLTFWQRSNRFFDDDGNLLVEIDGLTAS